MAKDSNIVLNGIIVEGMGGDMFLVKINGNDFKCKISGKLRKNKIRIVAGDGVEVEMSPYSDANSIGLISRRK